MLTKDIAVTPRTASFSRLSPLPSRSAAPASQDGYVPGSYPEKIARPEFDKEAPATEHGPKGWKKAVLAGSLALSAFTGLAPTAHAAIAAIQQAPRSLTNGMEVLVLPSGTPRLDIFQSDKRGIDREVSPRDYSQVGLSLGDGLFQDTEGNLSLVPFLAYN